MARRPGRLAAAAFLVAMRMALADGIPPGGRLSGRVQMGAPLRAMQDDDAANPATLWVLEGEALWNAGTGATGKACADCHGDATMSMKGVAVRQPSFDATAGRPVDLEQRIQRCRAERQGGTPWTFESRELLALTAWVARQSRGLPIAPDEDARMEPFVESGRILYERRQGAVDLACRHCHDLHWGRRLAGNPIPQGHPTAYPLYRLEWQGLGSLQRRLRACMASLRAEPYPYASQELVNLEAYLMRRARGMTWESPGVRP